MVVGEKFVFYEAYEEVGVARSHFGSHCNTVDLFVVVVTKRETALKYFFNQRPIKKPTSETLLRLAELVLTLNCFSDVD